MYTHMHVYIYVYIILSVIVFSSLSFYGEWTIPGTKRQPAILNLIDGKRGTEKVQAREPCRSTQVAIRWAPSGSLASHSSQTFSCCAPVAPGAGCRRRGAASASSWGG